MTEDKKSQHTGGMIMNLKEQEYVCALAENGTITAAAKELLFPSQH